MYAVHTTEYNCYENVDIKFSAHGVSDKFCERRNDFPGGYKYSVD
jgi:hypothetical protein